MEVFCLVLKSLCCFHRFQGVRSIFLPCQAARRLKKIRERVRTRGELDNREARKMNREDRKWNQAANSGLVIAGDKMDGWIDGQPATAGGKTPTSFAAAEG